MFTVHLDLNFLVLKYFRLNLDLAKSNLVHPNNTPKQNDVLL